ncbi:hypothetical protein HPB48_022765 [Haemaphysalis longicornis]|uniref:Uncharacterized protein n=1 Tax=Haemaphysalis longicornis TaxID=44386 RepID=A0A9J6FR16_HAELO|nr:hypothetical protein HPB48_022765 [Haemaphysalis longicornis]
MSTTAKIRPWCAPRCGTVASAVHSLRAKLKVVCVSASNTWGLFLLVLLLGHGLVEVPRGLWQRAQRGHALRRAYFRAAKLSLERAEAQERLDELLQEIQQVSGTISSSHHPLRRHLDVILAKLPEGVKASHGRQRINAEVDVLSGSAITERSLVRLHKQVIHALQQEGRTSCQWRLLVDEALHLEDVARNEDSGDHRFRCSSAATSRPTLAAWCGPTVEENRVGANGVCLCAVPLVVTEWYWLEMTFFIRSPMVSLFGLFHRAAEARHDYLAIELMSIVTLGYLCACAYYTVFRLRVLNYYYLAAHQQTDAYSLVFAGMLLCRLVPPLCLNFLGLLHLDTHVSSESHRLETAYTEVMGHLDLIPIVARGFNFYFPTLICVLCLATWWHLGSRLLHCLGFEQFLTDDELTGTWSRGQGPHQARYGALLERARLTHFTHMRFTLQHNRSASGAGNTARRQQGNRARGIDLRSEECGEGKMAMVFTVRNEGTLDCRSYSKSVIQKRKLEAPELQPAETKERGRQQRAADARRRAPPTSRQAHSDESGGGGGFGECRRLLLEGECHGWVLSVVISVCTLK